MKKAVVSSRQSVPGRRFPVEYPRASAFISGFKIVARGRRTTCYWPRRRLPRSARNDMSGKCRGSGAVSPVVRSLPTIHHLDPLGSDLGRLSSERCSEAWLSPDCLPRSRPSTLMSSSRSGQWIPIPSPMNRQFRRSSGVPCSRRGYQAMGIEIVRPSAKSTVNVSFVTVTSIAMAHHRDHAYRSRPRGTGISRPSPLAV